MSMERATSIGQSLEQLDLEKALQLLTYKIARVENDILIRHNVDKHKPMSDLTWRYDIALENLFIELTSISRRLFKNTTIKHVKPYKENVEAPDSYRAYLNAAHNLADLICYEITQQLDSNLALITIERWVWMLKNAFESNDFFIATSIINALRSAQLLKLKMEHKLSPVGIATLLFFEELLPNQGAVYQIQKKKFENGEEVVPILSTLTKMMDGIEQQPSSPDMSGKIETFCYIQKKKSRISLDFVEMQERLKTMLSSNTLDIIFILSKKPLPDNTINAIWHQKPDVDMEKLVSQLALYFPQDRYYEHHQELKQFAVELNQLANKLIASKNPLKIELCIPKCMDIKKILQDNETGFDEKLSSIMQMKLDPVCKSSNRISAILEKIEKVLIALADIQVRMKWQSTPRGRHSRSGSLITQSGFFAEKQFDAPTGDHEPHVRKDNTKS